MWRNEEYTRKKRKNIKLIKSLNLFTYLFLFILFFNLFPIPVKLILRYVMSCLCLWCILAILLLLVFHCATAFGFVQTLIFDHLACDACSPLFLLMLNGNYCVLYNTMFKCVHCWAALMHPDCTHAWFYMIWFLYNKVEGEFLFSFSFHAAFWYFDIWPNNCCMCCGTTC